MQATLWRSSTCSQHQPLDQLLVLSSLTEPICPFLRAHYETERISCWSPVSAEQLDCNRWQQMGRSLTLAAQPWLRLRADLPLLGPSKSIVQESAQTYLSRHSLKKPARCSCSLWWLCWRGWMDGGSLKSRIWTCSMVGSRRPSKSALCYWCFSAGLCTRRERRYQWRSVSASTCSR